MARPVQSPPARSPGALLAICWLPSMICLPILIVGGLILLTTVAVAGEIAGIATARARPQRRSP